MWLGEQMTEKGIGNGTSLIIFTGIVSSLPQTAISMISGIIGGSMNIIAAIVIVIVAVLLIALTVFVTNAERRIPVQYAKRVIGRKIYGGQSTNIPMKVNMSGVMPVIFASSILMIPGTIEMFTNPAADSFWGKFFAALNPTGWVYSILYFILIIAFAYFYTAIQYNPQEMANNLRKNNGGVPGIRPGKPTADYLAKIVGKITLIGALCLSIVALMPTVSAAIFQMNVSMGGTSIIILVGVALETVRQIESQMLMRHYKGFLQ
jgi:preprotein translocase subunit SecY